MRLLVTGATGKVGQALIARLLTDERWEAAEIRALCHNRGIEETGRASLVYSAIAERFSVRIAGKRHSHWKDKTTARRAPCWIGSRSTNCSA